MRTERVGEERERESPRRDGRRRRSTTMRDGSRWLGSFDSVQSFFFLSCIFIPYIHFCLFSLYVFSSIRGFCFSRHKNYLIFFFCCLPPSLITSNNFLFRDEKPKKKLHNWTFFLLALADIGSRLRRAQKRSASIKIETELKPKIIVLVGILFLSNWECEFA